MATDKSEPRVGVIFRVGILAVVTLVALRAALITYFDHAAQAEEQRKFGDVKPEALMRLREEQRGRLESGSIPIEKAMEQIASRGRMNASPNIVPTPSKDIAPLQGWMNMPSPVPSAMAAASAQPSPTPATSGPGDGGAPKAPGDGSAPKAAPNVGASEGGTSRNPP